ncbi:MAG TPA: hypothetical protein VJX67_26115 [Blastocatellia bacterium]|nr:hypothetical protein [Blastocatellia bacterium]
MNYRWLRQALVATAFGLLLAAWAYPAQAQEIRAGYTFVDVVGDRDKPVVSAAVIVYNSSGDEVLSGVTDVQGKASLLKNMGDNNGSTLIVRVLKRGFQTYESVFKSSDGPWNSEHLLVRLARSPSPKRNSGKTRRRNPRYAALATGLSPPSNSLQVLSVEAHSPPSRWSTRVY